jgi:dTDP-4-amino-4,6-dideoxygalactose transaminase
MINTFRKNNKINLFEPSYSKLEKKYINQTINSRWTGRGPRVQEFENKLGKLFNVDPQNLTTTTCATEGIFAIFDLIELKAGENVILPTISFIGMANAIKYYGAEAIFVDTNLENLQMDENKLLDLINSKTRAIILNHYGGYVVTSRRLIEIAEEKKIKLIEDSACAFAAKNLEVNKYAGTFADFGIWSFDSMKLITTGDGGLIYCKNKEDTNWIRQRNYFGLIGEGNSGFDKSQKSKGNWWDFNVLIPGRRAIMNDITASIGLAQLERLEKLIKKRRSVIKIYKKYLSKIPEIRAVDIQNNKDENSPYLFWIQTDLRDDLAKYLLSFNIYTTFRYLPLNILEIFSDENNTKQFPNSQKAYNTTLNLPLHANLKRNQVKYICKKIKDFFELNA